MFPPSGPPLSLGREQYAQSSRKPGPGTAGTEPRKLRGRPARTGPAIPFSFSMLSNWSIAGLVSFFFCLLPSTLPVANPLPTRKTPYWSPAGLQSADTKVVPCAAAYVDWEVGLSEVIRKDVLLTHL